MKYELVPLGELGEIVTGSTPDTTNKEYWDGDIPWITPANLTNHAGIYFTGELRKITEAGYKSCSTKMIPAGSIVYSTRAPIGHCAVTLFPLCTNQGFKSIVPNKRLDAVYGFFALKYFTPQLEALGRGATFTEVNKETFENFRIPLPPLEEQKRIASLLARADRLRQLRRAARQLSDSLLQSVFLEMFGDGKYGLMEFREVVKIDRTAASEEDVKTLPYVGLEDIEKDAGDFAKEYRPIPQNMLATNFRFTPNHVLYGKLRPYLNKVAMPSFSGVCTTEILPLLPFKGKINREYLWAYLRSKKFVDWASNNVSGANLPRLSPELLGDYPLPVPPLPLQEEFARVVARAEGLRARQAEAERQAEGLFQALLSESFG